MFSAVVRSPSLKSVQSVASVAKVTPHGEPERRVLWGLFTVKPVHTVLAKTSSANFSTSRRLTSTPFRIEAAAGGKPASLPAQKRVTKAIVAVGEPVFGSVSSALKHQQKSITPPQAPTHVATPRVLRASKRGLVETVKHEAALSEAARRRNNGRGPYLAEHGPMGKTLAQFIEQLNGVHYINTQEYNTQFNRKYKEVQKTDNPALPPFSGPVVVRGVLGRNEQFGQLIGDVPSGPEGMSQLLSQVNAMLQGGTAENMWIGDFLLHYMPRSQLEAREAIALKYAFKPGQLYLAKMTSLNEFEVDGGVIGPQDPEEVVDETTGETFTQHYPGGSWQWRVVDPSHAKKNIRVDEIYRLPLRIESVPDAGGASTLR